MSRRRHALVLTAALMVGCTAFGVGTSNESHVDPGRDAAADTALTPTTVVDGSSTIEEADAGVVVTADTGTVNADVDGGYGCMDLKKEEHGFVAQGGASWEPNVGFTIKVGGGWQAMVKTTTLPTSITKTSVSVTAMAKITGTTDVNDYFDAVHQYFGTSMGLANSPTLAVEAFRDEIELDLWREPSLWEGQPYSRPIVLTDVNEHSLTIDRNWKTGVMSVSFDGSPVGGAINGGITTTSSKTLILQIGGSRRAGGRGELELKVSRVCLVIE